MLLSSGGVTPGKLGQHVLKLLLVLGGDHLFGLYACEYLRHGGPDVVKQVCLVLLYLLNGDILELCTTA